MKSFKQLRSSGVLLTLTVLAAPAYAESESDKLAKQSANPISNLISVPFELNLNQNVGPQNKSLNILNIKPVIPVALNKDWNMINRAIVPLISQPGGPGFDRKDGLGDTTYQAFFSPSQPTSGGLIWGVGPQIQLPTHSDPRLGNDRWAAGPAVVALKISKKYLYGGLVSNIWDVTSDNKDPSINMMTAQPFFNYFLGDGWYLNSAPVITADWEQNSSGETWTVPVGGAVGRVVHWGKQAINLRAAYYGNVAHPDEAATYNIQFTAFFMFPK